jgi:hypothetical protein
MRGTWRGTWAALTASLVIASTAGIAHAYQLVSSPLPTNTNTSGACYIRNTGTTAVSVLVSLFSNNGLIVSFDNCNGDGPTIPGSLGPGKTCVILVDDLPDDSFVAC